MGALCQQAQIFVAGARARKRLPVMFQRRLSPHELAHLRRHFKKVLELPGSNNAAVAQVFLSLIDEAFIAHESWGKTKDQLTYDSWATDFKIRLNKALATWLNLVGYAAGLLLKSLRDKAEQWWYFLNDPSVPPDNNLAERSLRLWSRNGKFLAALVR